MKLEVAAQRCQGSGNRICQSSLQASDQLNSPKLKKLKEAEQGLDTIAKSSGQVVATVVSALPLTAELIAGLSMETCMRFRGQLSRHYHRPRKQNNMITSVMP